MSSASDTKTDVLDEDELTMVISAALAAYLGDEEPVVVTSLRRIEDTSSWSKTGRHDQMVAAL